MLTPENTSLWIVNFKREKELKQTIDMWLASFPFQDVNIISNSTPRPFSYDVKVWPNEFRENWETGAISWCWNQAMKHTFLDKDWCVMSQDDVMVHPGWDRLITDDYWTYIAPAGDVIQIQSVHGFNKIGWYDERFRAIGGGEQDYLLRMLRSYPKMLSVHDEHIWQMRHNDVGLADYFKDSFKDGEILQTRTEHNLRFANKEYFHRWKAKWNIHIDDIFLNKLYDIEKNWKEIDWYPAFTERMVNAARKEHAYYDDCI